MGKWAINGSNLTKAQKTSIDQEITALGMQSSLLPLGAKLFILRNELKTIPQCATCGTELKFHAPSCSYRTYCSRKCSAISDSTQNRKRDTNIKKYGATNVLHVRTEKANKLRAYNKLTRYDSFIRFAEYITPTFSREEFNGGCSTTNYEWNCTRCNLTFKVKFHEHRQKHPKCPSCDGAFTDIEDVIKQFLEKNEIEAKFHYRKILPNMELDFFLPKQQIAFETHGLYYHTENFFPDKNYHNKKTDLCLKKGIKLIQIFSDEIFHKEKQIINRIKSILSLNRKVFGRKCEAKEISFAACSAFLDKYHLQGSDTSPVRLGLFYKNRLVSVMTFCSLRGVLGSTSRKNHWELSRYASIGGFTIMGGFQKLLKRFIKKYKPNSLISYCDKRWTPNAAQSIYQKAGFQYVHTSKPNYWYVKKGLHKRLHRANFQKHKLLAKYPQFNSNQTENEIMTTLEYTKVWDCGHHKFELNFDGTS